MANCSYDGIGNVPADGKKITAFRSRTISGCRIQANDVTVNDLEVKIALRAKEFIDKFNVKYYGAVGDGVTDDAAAIQETIEAAAANGGGCVFLPIGSYLVSTSIILRSGVWLQGCGWSTSVVYGTRIVAGGDFPVVRTDPTISVATILTSSGVEKMTLYGFGKDNLNSHGLLLNWTNRVYIYQVRCHACRHAFDISNSFKTWLMDSHADGGLGSGPDQNYIGLYTGELADIFPTINNNALNVDNCNFYFTANTGIRLLSTMGTIITSTECGGNGLHGLHIGPVTTPTPQGQPLQFLHVDNCLFDSVPGWGILWERGVSAIGGTGNAAFSNIWCGNGALGGIRLSEVQNVSFTGSIIQNVGTGFQLEDCQHINITGLNLKDYDREATGNIGVQPIDTTDCCITNVIIDSPGSVGARYAEFGTTARIYLSNNDFGAPTLLANNNTSYNNFDTVTSNPYGAYTSTSGYRMAVNNLTDGFFVSTNALNNTAWRQMYVTSVESLTSASTTINVDQIVSNMDASGGAVALTLPDGVIAGTMKVLIRTDASGNTCVVTGTFDSGLTTATFPPATAYSALTIFWNGSTWVVSGNQKTVVVA